jgi:hypothetical protein
MSQSSQVPLALSGPIGQGLGAQGVAGSFDPFVSSSYGNGFPSSSFGAPYNRAPGNSTASDPLHHLQQLTDFTSSSSAFNVKPEPSSLLGDSTASASPNESVGNGTATEQQLAAAYQSYNYMAAAAYQPSAYQNNFPQTTAFPNPLYGCYPGQPYNHPLYGAPWLRQPYAGESVSLERLTHPHDETGEAAVVPLLTILAPRGWWSTSHLYGGMWAIMMRARLVPSSASTCLSPAVVEAINSWPNHRSTLFCEQKLSRNWLISR